LAKSKKRIEDRRSRIERARSSSIFDPLLSILILFGFGLLIFGFWFSDQSNAAGSEENSLDPTQIRRILISPERVPEILARVKKGILIQLPRQDFEEKVRRALRPFESAKNPPRLVEARYRATLMSTSLVGTAQWRMVNPVSIPGVLPLQPFNLALVKATLRKARFDTTAAIVGDWDGKGLGLLLDQPGEQAARLNWSARGELGPGGLHFDLQVPSCPVASLELDLPADLIVMPSGRETHLLTGPLATGNDGRSLWRIEFGGQAKVDLTLQARDDDFSRHPPMILAQVENTYDFSPEFAQADFEFKLEVPYHHLRKALEFEVDPVLRPIEVRVGNLEAWGSPSLSKLIVRLKEPFQGGSVLVRCLARLGPDHAWNCPGLRLRGAIPRGETIVFRLPADMQLDNWQAGDFRLTGSDPLADGRQLLTLAATNLNESGNPKRPSARINIPGPKYRVKQLAWWQIGSKGSTLTAQFLYSIASGQLFQLPLLLPAGWEVDKVELFPSELLRSWSVADERDQRTLLVDLQRPLTSSSLIPEGPIPNLLPRLSVWLRPASASRQGDLETTRQGEERQNASGLLVSPSSCLPFFEHIPLPDIVPRGAEFREGHLAISVDPIWQARVKATVAETAPEEKGPWGRQNPDFYFAFQGKPVEGSLVLQPRQPRITARCSSDVVVTPRHIAMAIRLALQPQVGGTRSILLWLSAPVPQLRNWQTKEGSIRVRQARPLWEAELAASLAALGAPTTLHALNYLASKPASGQLWLLTFERPLSERITLETTLDLAATLPAGRRPPDSAPTGEQSWDVPVPTVIGADSMEGELALRRAGAERLEVEATGLLPSGEDSGTEVGSSSKRFHYGPNSVTLKLRCQAAKATVDPIVNPVQADHVRLTTYVESPAKLVNYFSFRLVNWPQPTFPVRLPEGARLVGATVNGNWIPQLRWEETGEGTLFELPAMAGNAASFPSSSQAELGNRQRGYYQIVYSMGPSGWGLWSRMKAPLPELPVQRVLGLRRTWCLPPGLAPLDDGGLHPLPGLSEWVQGWSSLTPIRFPVMPLSLAEGEDWVDPQRRAMVEAGVRLRKELQSGDSITLGEGLEHVAFDFLQNSMPLVLDVRAFREANLGPVASLFFELDAGKNRSPFPWEDLGLVYVPFKPAPLLTTRSQLEAWNAAGQQNGESLASAIAEAAIHGRDRSGRFQTVAAWIQEDFPADGSPGSPRADFRSLGDFGNLDRATEPGWTEWEKSAGTDPDNGPVVIRRDVLIELSFFLSLLLLVAIWQARKTATWIGWLLLLAWLAGGSLALIWLPAPLDELARWPALTAWVVALFLFLKWSASPTAAKIKLGSAAAIGSAVCCVLGMPGHAAAPAPVIVYIVPGPAEAPAQQTVLAPPEVLEKLGDLADGVLSPRRGPMLVSARYHGTVAAGIADFKADFQVYSFGDGPFTMSIPLYEVTLRDALLDGAPANPTMAPAIPGRSPGGYSLLIRHRGTHAIRLHFTVPVQAAGDMSNLHFKIPELAMSRLILEAPPGSSFPHAVAAKGAQRVIPTAASSKNKGNHLEADLGQSSTLHVRWRHDEPPSVSPPDPGGRYRGGTVRVREAYFWDLGPYASSLFAFWHYTISQGAVTTLSLSVPEQLEVRNDPVVAKDPTEDSKEPPPRLKDWYWSGTGPQRRLVLEFIRPVTGTFQLLLEFVPRTPFGPDLELPLPAPQGVPASGEKGTDHFLAYRSQGLESQLVANLRVTGLEQDRFRQWWASSGLADPGPDFHAFGFQREPGSPPLLRLKLTPLTTASTGALNATWRLRKSQAELQATAKFISPSGELGLVEWEVPPEIGIFTVGGPQVRSWSRTGSRLQVWLKGLVSETTLQLAGWMPLGEEKEDRGSRIEFRLLPLRLMATPSLTTFVRIEADKDLALEPVSLTNLLPLPSSVISERERSYVADQGDYGGAFLVRSSRPPADGGSRIDDRKSRKIGAILDPQSSILRPRVLLADQQAAVVDGKHWEYQASYWISHSNDLTIRLPAGGKILEVTLDGVEVSPLPLEAASWWVPLAAGRAAQILRLRWTYEDAHLPVDQPLLESPRLEGLPAFDMIWTVHVPPGFIIAQPQASAQEITAGAKLLHAAEAQLRLSQLLAKQGRGRDHLEISSQLRATQERFYRYCGVAEHWLALTKASNAVVQEIRERNRKQANAQGFEKIRQRAEEDARRNPLGFGGQKENETLPLFASSLTDQGTPTYWFVTPGAHAPRLHLTPIWQRKIELATRATIVVIAILLAVVMASCIPKVRSLIRALGPEIIIFLGCLGWWWAGPDWLLLGLIALGLCSRLFLLFGGRTSTALSSGKEPESATKRSDRSTPSAVAGT
jgi:hypothetical protein